MDTITYITPNFAVTGALAPEDFPKIAALGFRAVVSNLPDSEEVGQLTGRDEAVLAWRSGLAFRHVPAPKHELFTDPVVEGMADALNVLDAPVLAHCKSGLRSVVLWAAASARSGQVDCVLDALRRAGFDPTGLRDELEGQAHRKRWLGQARALHCGDDAKTGTPASQRAAA
jgi:sulfide:quinone oxidoreductase